MTSQMLLFAIFYRIFGKNLFWGPKEPKGQPLGFRDLNFRIPYGKLAKLHI